MRFDPNEFDRSYPSSGEYPFELYLSNTFLWMFFGLLLTFGTALLGWMTGVVVLFFAMGGHIVLLIAQLAVAVLLSAWVKKLSVVVARFCFLAYSVLTGLTLSTYFYIFELGSMIFVFLVTAVFFGAFGLYGRTTKTDLSFLRPTLIGALAALIVYSLVALFVPGLGVLDGIVTLGAVALFLAYTAYDVQAVEYYYHCCQYDPDMLEKAAIFSALQLHLDFIDLFLHLLHYLGKRKD